MKKEIIVFIAIIIIIFAIILIFNFDNNPIENQKIIISRQKLSSHEIQALNLILDGEYKIRAISWRALDNFGRIQPFLEISYQQQVELIKLVYNRNNLTIPKDIWLVNIENFNSTKRACELGLSIEIKNLEIYDEFYSRLKDKDVIELFNIIKQASESNIIKFRRCN